MQTVLYTWLHTELNSAHISTYLFPKLHISAQCSVDISCLKCTCTPWLLLTPSQGWPNSILVLAAGIHFSQYGMVWYGVVKFPLYIVWYGRVWYGVVKFKLFTVWYGRVWFGVVKLNLFTVWYGMQGIVCYCFHFSQCIRFQKDCIQVHLFLKFLGFYLFSCILLFYFFFCNFCLHCLFLTILFLVFKEKYI